MAITLNGSGPVSGLTTLSMGGALTGVTDLSMSGGLATPSVLTVGQGIKFPATQSASSDANTLDDYEEGTWTPVFQTGGTQPTITYTTRTGTYTKIGRLVTCSIRIIINTTSGGSASVQIGGFPFACESTTFNAWSGVIGWNGAGSFNTAQPTNIEMANGYTFAYVHYYSNTQFTSADLPVSALQNNANIEASITYMASA